MNFKIIFVYICLVLAVMTGETTAGSKRWRKFEKKFNHALEKARDYLPVVQGYAGLAGGVAALGRR